MLKKLWNKLWEGWYPEPEARRPFVQGYDAWREGQVSEEHNPFVPGSVQDGEFRNGWDFAAGVERSRKLAAEIEQMHNRKTGGEDGTK